MNWRTLWWLLVNIALIPVYLALLAIALVLSVVPLNPTRLCWSNLRSRYGAGFFKAWVITVGVYLNYGVYALEALVFWRLGAVVVQNETEYFKFLESAAKTYDLKKSNKGFLFLGAHFCVIEQIGHMMNLYLRGHHGGEVNVLFKPARTPFMSWFLESYRRSRRFKAIRTGDAAKVKSAIETCLKNGDSLALVADQKPKKGGIFLEFFGEFAGFPFAGVKQAVGHPIVCVANTARRILPGMFRLDYALMPNDHLIAINPAALSECINSIQFEPAAIFDQVNITPLAGAHTVAVMAHYAGWLQKVIQTSPSQWCWDYRKWSRKPKG